MAAPLVIWSHVATRTAVGRLTVLCAALCLQQALSIADNMAENTLLLCRALLVVGRGGWDGSYVELAAWSDVVCLHSYMHA